MPSIAVDPGSLADAGDIPLGQEAQEARSAIEAALTRIVDECAVPFSLGGDPSVTYPVLRACRALAPVEALEGPLYVSLDLDGLAPAFAPGVSHSEPGGLSVRDVGRLLHRILAPIVGGDIVEYNPTNDVRDLTARVAATLVKEVAAVAIRNGGTARVARTRGYLGRGV